MTKEEKKRLKEGKKAAEKRAKAIRAEEKKREKQERKEAKRREKLERKLAKKNKDSLEADAVEENKEEQVEATTVVNETQESEVISNENDQEITTESRKVSTKRNYHVSLREDGKWQVKFAKGSRALKLFDTQVEAIAFAKQKAENQDGNITIHKKDGKIRKQNYAKKD